MLDRQFVKDIQNIVIMIQTASRPAATSKDSQTMLWSLQQKLKDSNDKKTINFEQVEKNPKN